MTWPHFPVISLLKEGAIVGLFQGTSHIFQGVAGAKAPVVLHSQEAAAQTSGHGLREAVTPAIGMGWISWCV